MNTHENTQDRLQNGYQSLLLGYAAGALDEAQSLAVSTHLEFSQDACNFVHSCEAIGGALIENECSPAQMSAGSLESVMERLDLPQSNNTNTPKTRTHDAIYFEIPKSLQTPLNEQTDLNWRTLYPGFHSINLELACKQSTARFLRLDPGVKSPSHSHGGLEITLVLDGAFSDETGEYKTGDLIVTDDSVEHAPTACQLQGCTCLVVSAAPIKLTGIARLLNPFLKP